MENHYCLSVDNNVLTIFFQPTILYQHMRFSRVWNTLYLKFSIDIFDTLPLNCARFIILLILFTILGVMIGGAPLDITSATGSQFLNGCGSKAKCQTNVCSKGSVCKEHWRVTSCECRNGYVGQKCVDICTLQPCQNAAICNRTDDAMGFQCTCPDKYLGKLDHILKEGLTGSADLGRVYP